MNRDPIARIGAKMLVPFILLFALYVQFHGDFGPGGGFQAGVIFAAAFVLYILIQGLTDAVRVTPRALLPVLLSVGLLIYIGTGFLTLFLGGNFLDYRVLGREEKEAQELGIMLIELGVGITVFAAMLAIVVSFAARRRS